MDTEPPFASAGQNTSFKRQSLVWIYLEDAEGPRPVLSIIRGTSGDRDLRGCSRCTTAIRIEAICGVTLIPAMTHPRSPHLRFTRTLLIITALEAASHVSGCRFGMRP